MNAHAFEPLITFVMLSAAKHLRNGTQILRFAQDDMFHGMDGSDAREGI
jgi:hypothetical protein